MAVHLTPRELREFRSNLMTIGFGLCRDQDDQDSLIKGFQALFTIIQVIDNWIDESART